MIELAAPRPDRPDRIKRRFAQCGEVFELNGALWPFINPEVDRQLENLRTKMAARIDAAFACHARHHLRDIERRFKYADRPDLRVFDQESRRMLGELCIAVLRGEL